MKDVKITVMTRAEHHDLIEKYENPIEHACEFSDRDSGVIIVYKQLVTICNQLFYSSNILIFRPK